VNQLVDIVKFSSGTLLSRKAKNSRGVSGMHMRTRRIIPENRLRLSPFPKRWVVFIVRFLDGMEPQEISAATGMSLSTVKTAPRVD
jgi:hypothetical protein